MLYLFTSSCPGLHFPFILPLSPPPKGDFYNSSCLKYGNNNNIDEYGFFLMKVYYSSSFGA